MADIQLQTILNSGNLNSIYLGGTTTGDKVLKKSEVDFFDNSPTALNATTQQAAIEELANVGLSHMTLNTPYTGGQIINLTPIKISLFNTINHNINGAVTPLVDTNEATHTHKFTINKNGLYSVSGTVNAEFTATAAITLQMFKNGVAATPPATLQGAGAGKPVMFTYTGLFDLVATDYLELYALSDTSSTSFLVVASSVVVERKPLS